jgi:hypothetical protein
LRLHHRVECLDREHLVADSRTIWSSTRVVWSASIERATRIAIACGVLVDDVDQFQLAAVAGGVELEVLGPDIVGALGSPPLGGASSGIPGQ